MSNINKQELRLTAEKAKDNFMPNFMVPTRDVLALLDELEGKEKQRAAANKVVVQQDIELQELRLRIAELEAREVVLPRAHDVHPLGPQSEKIFCEFHRSIVNRCADEIRKVGVKVSIKGN